MKNTSSFKDKIILFSWTAGLLLIISLLWIVTQPLQSHYLMRAVNGIFINNNDIRRVSASIQNYSGKDINHGRHLFGYWYSMHNSSDKMFVFTVFKEGIMIPLGAIVSPDGKVNEIIPLSSHAGNVFKTFPESIMQMYINRIEGNR